jgi:nickel-type superoxide dismutase maturation protease
MNLRGRLRSWLPVMAVEVTGDSMVPTYRSGDWLLVRRTRKLAVGDVVVVPDPRDDRRILIKRITGRVDGGWFIQGDDPAHSTDSRRFGPISPDAVIGVVVCRYHRGG